MTEARYPAPMLHEPDKRTLLLFGPGLHFGVDIARRFASEGFVVALVARTQSRLDDVARRLRETNVHCVTARADVTDPVGLRLAVQTLGERSPPIQCLIYNVKSATRGSGLDVEPAELTRALSVNVSGAVGAIQVALPWMQRGSTIILTGGGYKDRPDPNKLALSVSKAALHALFLSMSLPLSYKHINLKTVILDGAVREEGPLRAVDAAALFWSAFLAPRKRTFVLRTPPPAADVRQLNLIVGGSVGGQKVASGR